MTGEADKTRAAGPMGGSSAMSRLVRAVVVLLVVGCSTSASADSDAGFTIAQLKYRGGGDWYANPTALPNLLAGISSRTDLEVARRPATVAPDDDELFLYPMIHMTGHGRVAFTDEEADVLREYFERGGFLWADDNYGMDRHFRAQLDRVLPGAPLVELPFDHEIFHSFYEFPEGLPKIHEHDGGPPHGYGVYLDGRMVVFYSFNTDIGDGLEDGEVHNDPPEKREAALRMGVNIAVYALSH
ncbi:MAG: DUF4159 domain-containing protein [Candidatus Eisenbacteria bacterium]